MRNLVELIAAQGMRTNPDEPGTECLVMTLGQNVIELWKSSKFFIDHVQGSRKVLVDGRGVCAQPGVFVAY